MKVKGLFPLHTIFTCFLHKQSSETTVFLPRVSHCTMWNAFSQIQCLLWFQPNCWRRTDKLERSETVTQEFQVHPIFLVSSAAGSAQSNLTPRKIRLFVSFYGNKYNFQLMSDKQNILLYLTYSWIRHKSLRNLFTKPIWKLKCKLKVVTGMLAETVAQQNILYFF